MSKKEQENISGAGAYSLPYQVPKDMVRISGTFNIQGLRGSASITLTDIYAHEVPGVISTIRGALI